MRQNECCHLTRESHRVSTGKWKSLEVAVKSLKPGKMSKEEFLCEAKLMHKLQHRQLVQLLAVCTDSEPIYIITELMSNGAFLDFLRQDDGAQLRLPILMDMAAQVLYQSQHSLHSTSSHYLLSFLASPPLSLPPLSLSLSLSLSLYLLASSPSFSHPPSHPLTPSLPPHLSLPSLSSFIMPSVPLSIYLF